MAKDEAHEFRDAFFLNHLQSIKGNDAWYQNQKFLGKGGNGTTFLVTCTSGQNLGVQFALKVFHRISDARRRERFLEEVKHYRSLSHPSIIDVYDEGTYKLANGATYPFAVVEYVPRNLEDILGRGLPKISRLEAIRYIFNTASALAFLHNRPEPIIHRDIKPANILVDDHKAKLGDLGLAKVMIEHDSEAETDLSAYAAGPFFYRTPELVEHSKGQHDAVVPASDIFQLGLVLYRSVTGFNPLKAPENFTDPIELDVRQIQGVADGRINDLVANMLKMAPTDRPSIDDVLTKINEIHSEVCLADAHASGIFR